MPRHDDPSAPYGAYALILGAFAAELAATGVVSRKLDREPQWRSALDLALLAGASFKTARTLARERVGSVVRDPLTGGETSDDEPVPDGGMRQAVGELVTCTRCVGTWGAAGLLTSQVIAPRFGRLLTWSLAAAAANDFLQAAFAEMTKAPPVDGR